MTCPRCRKIVPAQAPFCPHCGMSFLSAAPRVVPTYRPAPWGHSVERWLSFGDVPWKNFAVGGGIVALFALWAIADIAQYAGAEPKRIHSVYAESGPKGLRVAFILVDDQDRAVSAEGKATVEVVTRAAERWRLAYRRSHTVRFANFRHVTIRGDDEPACYLEVPYAASTELRAASRGHLVSQVRIAFARAGSKQLRGQSVEFPLAGM